MKKMTKSMSVLLALVLVVSMLAACSTKNTENNTSSSKPPATNTPGAAESAKPTDSGLSGKVVFWSMWSSSEPQAKVIEAAIKEFKTANPNVTVDLKFTGRDITKLIKPALDGGEAIDIWEGDPGSASGISGMKEHVEKLDPYLTQDAIGMEGKSVQDSIIPSLMNWVKTLSTKNALEEGIYAIPQQPFAVLFFYNKEVYEKAGVTAVPQTWEQFMAANEKVKAAGSAPITFDDAYRSLFIGGYLASAMGHEWVEQLVTDKTGEMWNDPIITQFANEMAEMAEKGYFSSKLAANKYPAAQQDLVLGGSASYLNGSWLPNEVIETSGPDFKWGSYQFPEVANGNGNGGHQGLTFGAQGIFINKASKNKEAAFELIKYLVSKSTQEQMAKEALAIPATVDSEWPAQLAEVKTAFDNAKVNMPWSSGIDTNSDFMNGSILPIFMDLATGKLKASEYGPKMSEAAKKFYSGK